MRVMQLKAKSGECELIIGETVGQLGNYCKTEKIVIITDSNVRKLHGGLFPKCELIEIGTGEGIKTIETVNAIYEQLLEHEIDKSAIIIGIGGGIVCDITGFVATTYLRGIRFGFVPTTLLAQVDASIGGKNGVNFKGYKNMVGTIKQPEFCLFDFDLLKTLPERELKCGFAEVVKHAAIGDSALFAYLEVHVNDALSLKKTAIEKVVYDSLVVKAGVVTKDETEKGERMKLNFGHTIGHSIEKAAGIPHGEAVAIGMAIAANISAARGMIGKKDAERIIELLNKIGLPTSTELKTEVLIDAMRKDKKRRGNEINMVLLESIGKAKIETIKISELEGVLNDAR